VSGFRPFIYRIAQQAGVRGYVKNLGGAEVEIHIEGTRDQIRKFFTLFWKTKPECIIVEEVRVRKVSPAGFSEFRIEPSGREAEARSVIPPDFAVCDECLREVLNPEDVRRFRYPFNSCVYCGPRFSMMYDNPWDRENTAMRMFPLCEYCLKEYTDPNNVRRFHAQGISCKICGPRVWLCDRDGNMIEVDDPIREAAKLINEGYIVAVKGLGGFHIACLATDDDVVLRLRRRKRRPEQPFAIMVLNLEVAEQLVELDDNSRRLLTSFRRPIVLLPMKDNAPISKYVAPGLSHLGIFLPYTPLHYLLLMDVKDRYAIMTSGNVHGKPMCTKNDEALRHLRDIVDFFLLHNRDIVNRVDDSVLRFTAGEPILLRRGRGYAPYWIKVPVKTDRVIVCLGALLQNAGAIMFDNRVVLTQYIGDCNDLDTLRDLEHYIKVLARFYRVNLQEAIFVTDLHPAYETTMLGERLAEEHHGQVIRVQHHWAHIASAMADRGISPDEEVIGVAIDGVGYGLDGQVWGCEIMYATYRYMHRIGHLKYVKMLGGDLATYYPVRMVISYLMNILDRSQLRKLITEHGLVHGLRYGEDELEVILSMYDKESIYTSSIGRLLDAVSCLLKICLVRTYEGEPAIKLEAAAWRAWKRGSKPELIELRILQENGEHIVDPLPIFEYIIDKFYTKKCEFTDKIALSVLYSVGYAIGQLVKKIRKRNIKKIVVSGGAAVNEFIIMGLKESLKDADIKILLPRQVPPNDGGIALGQAVIAAALTQ